MEKVNADQKRNLISRLFKWGTILLSISTVLLVSILYVDNKINHHMNVIETYDDNHNEYLTVDLLNNIHQSTFKMIKLIKDEYVDTAFKHLLLNNLDSTIHNLSVQSTILLYPGDIVVNEQTQLMLLQSPQFKLNSINKGNSDTNIKQINASSKQIKKYRNIKEKVTYLIIILQIIGLVLNQRALILQIEYKI